MKRRNFVKTSAAAVGLVGTSLEISPLKAAADNNPKNQEDILKDNRPEEYLDSVRKEHLMHSSIDGKKYLFAPMSIEERIRRKIVPQTGFCSLAPAQNVSEALITGNGAMTIELLGHPYDEQILFHHESLMMPWKKPLEAPEAADILQQVRQLFLDGKTKEANSLAISRMNQGPVKQDTEPHLTIPAHLMKLTMPENQNTSNFLRTVDFETGEIRIFWSDDAGEWVRKTFASRPDNVIVQLLKAPEGKTINVRIALQKSAAWSLYSGMDWGALKGIGTTEPDMTAFVNLTEIQKKLAPKGVETCIVRQDVNGPNLVYKCLLDESVNNNGYAAVTRIVIDEGSFRKDGESIVIEKAKSVMLLTRIEYLEEFSDDKANALIKEVANITPDYTALIERHQKIHSEMLNRVTIDYGGHSQYGMSAEELLSDQRSRPDYSPALLEKMFQVGRYWSLINTGKYPAISTGVNSTINLQMAGAVQGDMKETLEAYFRWMEDIAQDCRNNAKNIFGFRGTSYPLFPDKGTGVKFYYTDSSDIGIWPYWISAGGWFARHFWDHYLVTGDSDFLRDRVIPVYSELAQFYEDYLTETDKDGNYIFVPSISPENIPLNRPGSGPILVNATMDIMVCREVLTNLIDASKTLGINADKIPKWNALLSKMPPYIVESDGTLKEWAWPSIQEHYSHRHVSHLYGAWPGDEIDPDITPDLAKAALLANRRRTFDAMSTAVAGETLPAYGRCHRALAGARLKDSILVDIQLRQLLEQGYVSAALRCSREPYGRPVPDAQTGIPAIIIEMLLYSRPGVIEVLPALPETLIKGSVNGLLARSFIRVDNLTWDMLERSIDLTITSLKKQDVTLLTRYGIEEIYCSPDVSGNFSKGKADCELHLPENEPIKIHLEVSDFKKADWVSLIK
ncbi:MAG TPA: glycoside hydrolase N-terminal domain-containing protein [Bacteroidales bacterium]|nr:glycoside hydrolase N-terminal domain-containing protein [Bacteroidales bacterium]